jgi:hypothetical protein
VAATSDGTAVVAALADVLGADPADDEAAVEAAALEAQT